MSMQSNLALQTSNLSIKLNAKGGLLSLADAVTGQEFIAEGCHPLYRMELSEACGKTVILSSLDAASIEVSKTGGILEIVHQGHGHYDIDVRCTVTTSIGGLAHWRIAVDNRTQYGVRSLAYPVVAARPMLGDSDEDDYYCSGRGFGLLVRQPASSAARRDCLDSPIKGSTDPEEPTTDCFPPQYPGPVVAQMQCYYDGTAGLYMAAYDGGGSVKVFDYCRKDDGPLDLSIVHHHDERPGLSFELPYDTVTGVFHGDWYDGADIYRQWAWRQSWCAKKLGERDVPSWVTEPRAHMMVITRGSPERSEATLPSLPAEYPLDKFWPYRKLLARFRRFREAFGGPITAWLEGWELYGSPAGPVDIFPPYEGEESFKAALRELYDDGFVVSLYLAAFHWCYRRANTGYAGEERFERDGRPVCAVNPDGSIDRYIFGGAQKHFANMCVGSPESRAMLRDNFAKLAEYGGQWLQLDQQIGLYSPVCYSDRHGHAPGYGSWMTESMREFSREIRALARQSSPDGAYSCENACEFWIQDTDLFMDRPYLMGDKVMSAPVFEYIYHEYAAAYGGDVAIWLTHREVACIKHAYCCVYGLQNLVCINQPDYDIDVEEADHPAVLLLRDILAAQRGYARDYLVFGRMGKPCAAVCRTERTEFWCPPGVSRLKMRYKKIPAVLHGCWQAPSGRHAVVLVNWTGVDETVTIKPGQWTQGARLVCARGAQAVPAAQWRDGELTLTVQARSVILVEQQA